MDSLGNVNSTLFNYLLEFETTNLKVQRLINSCLFALLDTKRFFFFLNEKIQ